MQNTLKLISIQHELAMAIGLDLRLKPMLLEFMKTCVHRLNLRGVHVYLVTDQSGVLWTGGEVRAGRLRHYLSYPETQSVMPHQFYELAETLDRFPYSKGRNFGAQSLSLDARHYHLFALCGLGVIVLERSQIQLQADVLAALIPLFERLSTSCRASLEYERSLQEIIRRKKVEEDLRLAATAFETHEAIMVTDCNANIKRVNRAFTRILGYSSDEVVGHNPRIFKSGRHDGVFYKQMWGALKTRGHWQGEIWNRRKNGEVFPEWQSITAVKDEAGAITHFVSNFQDITDRKEAEARIRHLAYHDSLTNLPNRSLLLDRLQRALNVAARRNLLGAVLFLDIDRFKTINDALGHSAGDEVLLEVARRLTTRVRREDTVARLGGDEFVVLLPQIGQDPEAAAFSAQTVAEKIRASLAEVCNIQGHEYLLSSSIGVVLFPEHGDSADDVLKYADAAMYKAKAAGRNTICFYSPGMQAAANERLMLEKDLRRAIERSELSLHFQPQINDTGQIIGAEALVRWQHRERGMIPPDKFIPVAEETGEILAIGEWVLRAAISQMKACMAANLYSGSEYIAVNVSPRQFHQEHFVQQIIAIVEEMDISPSNLKLEITEGLVMADVNDAIEKMRELKRFGVRFAIDDFGTGYSSLAYLKRLPLDQLKIDKSFVQEIEDDSNGRAIVETIIAMARHLGLEVIAEGVETEVELNFLRSQGCTAYQGYYFSRPLPAADFIQFKWAS